MDEAIALHEPMMQFLQQDMQQSFYMDGSVQAMRAALSAARPGRLS
jgi:flagellar biosynthesis/type III secretory pathway ATPase